MNILEFVEQGGNVKTSNGNDVHVLLSDDEHYPIYGTVVSKHTGNNFECKWDENGIPYNLPETHGWELHPVVEIKTYTLINKSILGIFTNIQEFKNYYEESVF